NEELIPLTPADMERFHRCAAAALARRGGGALALWMTESLQLIVMGALPIVGLLWLGWSATELVLFTLAATWVGMVCDFARLAFARSAVKEFLETQFDDWHVWVVVEALRSGK